MFRQARGAVQWLGTHRVPALASLEQGTRLAHRRRPSDSNSIEIRSRGLCDKGLRVQPPVELIREFGEKGHVEEAHQPLPVVVPLQPKAQVPATPLVGYADACVVIVRGCCQQLPGRSNREEQLLERHGTAIEVQAIVLQPVVAALHGCMWIGLLEKRGHLAQALGQLAREDGLCPERRPFRWPESGLSGLGSHKPSLPQPNMAVCAGESRANGLHA